MKEWHRTIVLLLVIAAAIGVIVWLHTGFEDQMVDSLT